MRRSGTSRRACTIFCALLALARWARGGEPVAPEWPEDLGALTAVDRDRAIAALRDLTLRERGAERLAELRLRRALLDLAPLPGRDAARAREGLNVVATSAGGNRWGAAARYALAWLEETEGSLDRARDAYRELVVDDPHGDAARRAGTAFGRLELRRDQPAEAAVWLQAAMDRGGAPGAQEYREAAVRGLLQVKGPGPSRTAGPRAGVSELREAAALSRGLTGDVFVADRKRDLVVRFDDGERPGRTWPLAGVTALAVDPFGRAFAAASGTILRLDGDSPAVVARSGSFGAASALAVDAVGRIWIADRRGERVGVAHADGTDPQVVRAKKGERIEALAWDGRGVVALDAAAGRVVALALDGTERVLVTGLSPTPVALGANAAGSLAVLDEAGGITVVSATGRIVERIDAKRVGIARPGALGLGPDATIDCFDAADGRLVRLR